MTTPGRVDINSFIFRLNASNVCWSLASHHLLTLRVEYNSEGEGPHPDLRRGISRKLFSCPRPGTNHHVSSLLPRPPWPSNCANVIELTISKCTTSIHCCERLLGQSIFASVDSQVGRDWPSLPDLRIRIRFRRLRPLINYCQINKFAMVCLAEFPAAAPEDPCSRQLSKRRLLRVLYILQILARYWFPRHGDSRAQVALAYANSRISVQLLLLLLRPMANVHWQEPVQLPKTSQLATTNPPIEKHLPKNINFKSATPGSGHSSPEVFSRLRAQLIRWGAATCPGDFN